MKDEALRLLRLFGIGLAGVLCVAIYLEFDKRPATHAPASKVQLSPAELKDTVFRLPLATGGALNSSELLGQPVILNFWASWCDACKEERPQIAEVEAFAKDRMVGIGTLDQKDKLIAYDTEHPHGYRILIDEAGDVAAKFQVSGLPHTFLLGADGKVLARVVGALKESDVAELKRLFDASRPTQKL